MLITMTDSDSKSDCNDGASTAKKIRRYFTAEQKLEIVKYAKSISIHSASKYYKADRKNIRCWITQEEDLKKLW